MFLSKTHRGTYNGPCVPFIITHNLTSVARNSSGAPPVAPDFTELNGEWDKLKPEDRSLYKDEAERLNADLSEDVNSTDFAKHF